MAKKSTEVIKKTFKQIREFNQAVNSFINRKPTNIQTKLGYAIKRVSDVSIKEAVEKYQKEQANLLFNTVEKVQIDNALTDPVTKAVLTAPKDSDRPYLYDAKGLLVVREAERKFNDLVADLLSEWDNKEFDIDTYFAVSLPHDLTEIEKEAFTGFAIDPSGNTPVEKAPVVATASLGAAIPGHPKK